MRTFALALATLAGCAAAPQIATHPIACHHDAPGQSHALWQQEILRLERWLADPDHRRAVQRDPAAIAGWQGQQPPGPITTNVRWLPHWIGTTADGRHWQVPFARINSVAVAAYDPRQLQSGPRHRDDRLLEFVPLATSTSHADVAAVRAALAANDGRTDAAALDRILGPDALVVDGAVHCLPTSERGPFRDRTVVERTERQLAEERRLAQAAGDQGARCLLFEELRFDATHGLRDAPAAVRELDGAAVVMVGRMLPIDEVTAIRRFLLVQSPWSDDWGRPAALQDVVEVQLQGGATVDWSEAPLCVRGTLRVRERREDDFLTSVFQLEASGMAPIE